MNPFRLRTYLLVYCTLVPLMVTAAIVLFFTHRFNTYAVDGLTNHGKEVASNIAFSVVDNLINESYAQLQEFIQEYVAKGGVDAVQISDTQGVVLAASDIAFLGTLLGTIPAASCVTVSENVCINVDTGKSQLVVTVPIVVGKTELGKTRIFLSMRDVLVAQQEMRKNGILIGIGFCLLAIVMGLAFANILTDPVQRFMVAADRISRGDFQVQLPKVKWVLELNRFGQTLEVMANAIASREKNLLISEKKFRNLFERAIEGIFVTDDKGQLLDVNPAFIKILSAASREILLNQNLFANIFENEESLMQFKEQIARQGFVQDYELTLIKSDNSSVIVSLNCHVVKGDDGIILKYEGLVRDISPQKNAENEIIRIRNYLNNIIESMPSMLVTLDVASVVTQWNSAACQITGIASQDAVGRNIYDVAPFFSKYTPLVDDTNSQRSRRTLRREQLMPDSTHLYDMTFFPLVANGVSGIAIRLDDITELDIKEQQLRQAQKMESVGTLAGGLAHDFNNVLAAILGNLSLLQYRLRGRSDVSTAEILEYLERMESAGARAVDMVKQLLTLSRRHQADLVPVDLNLSAKHVRKLGENTFDKSVQVVVHLAAAPAYVLADITEIEQVLLNLCINGIHAMTIMRGNDCIWGGTLTITINQVKADGNFQQKHPESMAGRYWKLSVSDTGVGMDTTTAAKIFDPFFTTKGQGKGTGLGLAMVYNIVQQQHGFIDVYSEVGMGSTFSIYLPALERETRLSAVVDEQVRISQGQGVILVVDDDDIVRGVAESILKTVGYTVLTAKNGREGVEKYREVADSIIAVLLDMAMPVMSGREAFIEMKAINPEVKVLLASGFRKDERVEEILGLGVKAFLQKPYTVTTLAQAMKKVIDS